uniref:Uncharacterized protein n=1 Tax=Glossina brevipalpis TaxID=37001 RepID=A0A1A9WNR9_9MUSC
MKAIVATIVLRNIVGMIFGLKVACFFVLEQGQDNNSGIFIVKDHDFHREADPPMWSYDFHYYTTSLIATYQVVVVVYDFLTLETNDLQHVNNYTPNELMLHNREPLVNIENRAKEVLSNVPTSAIKHSKGGDFKVSEDLSRFNWPLKSANESGNKKRIQNAMIGKASKYFPFTISPEKRFGDLLMLLANQSSPPSSLFLVFIKLNFQKFKLYCVAVITETVCQLSHKRL